MTTEQLSSGETRVNDVSRKNRRLLIFSHYLNRVLLLAAVASLFYGLVWNYSTRKYLKGFSDAIVPLEGSPEEKSEALLGWLREEPERRDPTMHGASNSRDPVGIVQDTRLLKVCGSASNAFINLAEAAGLRTRRLLLLDASGGTHHVVVEVKWDERWVVVDPSFRSVFRDHSGRALTREDLREPEIFREATSRIRNYNPTYTFDHTVHIHLTRIPILGSILRRGLDFLFPRWEEVVNWGYFPENPSIWPILVSLPLFLLGICIRLIVLGYGRGQLGIETVGFRRRLMETGRVLLHKSA
jgi:hypothetical protein